MVQAHAFLGNQQVHHTFKFNPDAANWSYKENTSSIDTIGGRVVQLLSVQVDGVSFTGKAGSRAELQRLADNVKAIMNYHVRTSRPVQFKVPSRNWNFLVYVQAMPQIGWDVSATSYPYQIQLAVDEDIAGVISKKIENKALRRLSEGIGYNPAVHGGNTAAFIELVDTVLKMAPEAASSGVTSKDGSGESINLPPGGDAVSQRVLEYASSQIGVMYDFGEINPLGSAGGEGSGFDCSGLTQWAYTQAGVGGLVHSAQSQYDYCRNRGVFISDAANLQPGDLMFFKGPCIRGGVTVYICHVGLFWEGNGLSGKILHAYSTGSPVEINDIASRSSSFVGGGRPR